MDILDEPAGVSCLAGFESWRHDVWGSERVRALGAEFFPRLAHEDLYIAQEQIEQFQRECRLLRENIEIVAFGTGPLNPKATYFIAAAKRSVDPPDSHAAFLETVSKRLANIEAAVQRAVDVEGGVVIW